jgi:hypothetical protein
LLTLRSYLWFITSLEWEGDWIQNHDQNASFDQYITENTNVSKHQLTHILSSISQRTKFITGIPAKDLRGLPVKDLNTIGAVLQKSIKKDVNKSTRAILISDAFFKSV